ncbi:MAG TPA: lysophospholipid acyltransferase family protein [Elusimicrobiota bacterium]|nr:lysophospholipid acyltransferase family protein [Elusimicrobiota bacterium]
MARNKSGLTIACEYYTATAFFSLMKRIRREWAEQLSGGLLRAILWFMPQRRRLMRQHIAASFPELDPPGCARVASRSLDNLAKGLVVLPRLPAWAARGRPNWVQMEGMEFAHQAYASGKGVVAFTAHYGCWEATAAFLPKAVGLAALVARPLDNPRLNRSITAIRASGGAHVIPRRRMLREGLAVLRQKGFLGILIDQNYADGVFVDFFGRPAATSTIVPLLARRTGSVILGMYSRWFGSILKIYLTPPVELSTAPDKAVAVHEDTQRITRIVEGWIRDDPGQWLWLHNRWKHQPLASPR